MFVTLAIEKEASTFIYNLQSFCNTDCMCRCYVNTFMFVTIQDYPAMCNVSSLSKKYEVSVVNYDRNFLL